MRLRAISLALLGASVSLWSELLPIRTYSITEGLLSNRIDCIVPDSRGFVWFCTPEGLSRFDGYRITTFGTAEGLPHRAVQAFLETRSGDYLIGTRTGLCQFRRDPGKHQFAAYTVGGTPPQNDVTALLESSSGKIWCGTSDGLFQMLPGFKFQRQSLPPPPVPWNRIEIAGLAEDSCGKLWLASSAGIYVMATNGSVQRLDQRDGLPGAVTNALLADRNGNIWAGVRGGLTLLRDGCSAGAPGVQRVYPPEFGRNVAAITEGPGNAIWLATEDGVTRLLPGGDGASRQHLTRRQGLTDRVMVSIASDKSGNIWAGTEGAGVMSIQPDGFTTFREQDGLASDRVWSVLGDREGNVVTVSADQSQLAWSLNVFDGKKFQSMPAPKTFADHRAWGNDRILIQGRTGEWWGATSQGLCRYAPVRVKELAQRVPEACYGEDLSIFQVFEDSKGGIWASAQSMAGDRLVRWDPERKTLVSFPQWPRQNALVKSFAEDRQGNIWMGLWVNGSLYRYDGQQFVNFLPKDGVPAGTIFALLTDIQGRLWIGATSGLGLLEHPGAGPFHVHTFDRTNGLSSSIIRALLEDRNGFIYVATGVGVDRLNPATGRFKHFSEADGLARGAIESAFRDSAGTLWFGATQGLSRLPPEESHPLSNPAVLITSLQTGGAPFPVSQRGETSISRIELEPSRNQLQVEFVAFTEEPEANLRYAYKLEGSDTEWSPPRSQHVVNYAALAPGKYRFQVKAVNSDGLESATPAEVDFIVLPPIWRRWWFEGMALATLTLMVYLLHRYRVSQAVSLERMRTAIATDLHDDIGASLSQIAILSEVARAGVGPENRLPQESLEKVGSLARELVDSLSEIVWSIRSEPDGLDSLVRRMREFALDLLVSQGIDFVLRAPQGGDTVHLSLHARRQLFLMFKECIHNVSRHSGCTSVRAELQIEDREIALTVEDNGTGFSQTEKAQGGAGGNGIPGMRRRAESLGGSIQFHSPPGQGCKVSIRLPVRRGAFANARL